jgi:predicted Zn-dependent protease
LQKAAHLRPENPRFFYVCAVALAETGKLKQSVSLLQEGLSHHPNDRTLLQSLMTYAKQAGDRALASEAAARLAGVGDLLDR